MQIWQGLCINYGCGILPEKHPPNIIGQEGNISLFPECLQNRILLIGQCDSRNSKQICSQLFLGIDARRPRCFPTASTWHCQKTLAHKWHTGRGNATTSSTTSVSYTRVFKVMQIQTWVDITKKEYSRENGPYKREISVQGKWRR